MTEIINFTFNESNANVRVIMIDSKPYFCLQDVCSILSLNNITRLRERLDTKGVYLKSIPTNGGEQKMYFVSEKNLYQCIFKSKKKEALKFQDWVFEFVLPKIRETGSFSIKHDLSELMSFTKRETQIQKSKEINALQFALGGVEAVKEYNRMNCKMVTGMETKQVKSLGEKVGLKSKQRASAKETLRNIPELQSKACTMTLNDAIVTQNPKIKLQKLQEIDKNADKVFQNLLDLGIKPAELNK